MASLAAYIGATGALVTGQLIHAEPGAVDAKSNIVALALVEKNTLPDFGQSYTYGTSTTVVLGGSNIVAVLRDLAFQAKCRFFLDNTVNGKQTIADEGKASAKFGTEAIEKRTGDVGIRVDITYRDSFRNIPFFNGLRDGSNGDFDIYLFTDRTVEVVRWDADSPTFHDVKGGEKTGNYNDDITGSFSFTFMRRGELVPEPGVDRRTLKQGFAYTFAAPTPTPTNLTAVPGSTERFTVTATGTAAKLQRQVVQTGAAVVYGINKNDTEDIPTGEPVTIDSTTGEINIGTTLAIGIYRYTVTAVNAAGVWGKYKLVLIVK